MKGSDNLPHDNDVVKQQLVDRPGYYALVDVVDTTASKINKSVKEVMSTTTMS